MDTFLWPLTSPFKKSERILIKVGNTAPEYGRVVIRSNKLNSFVPINSQKDFDYPYDMCDTVIIKYDARPTNCCTLEDFNKKYKIIPESDLSNLLYGE